MKAVHIHDHPMDDTWNEIFNMNTVNNKFMGKSKKGLADTGDGEFVLNESGTSVSTDKVEEDDTMEAPEQDDAQEPERQ